MGKPMNGSMSDKSLAVSRSIPTGMGKPTPIWSKSRTAAEGLSPRVWGNQSDKFTASVYWVYRVWGSYYAHTKAYPHGYGETSRSSPLSESVGIQEAYPHGYGETGYILRGNSLVIKGLSPRVWGNRRAVWNYAPHASGLSPRVWGNPSMVTY